MEDRDPQHYEKFDSLIARYRTLIERLCMRFAAGDAERCAELRQDCYISLWHYLPTLRDGSSPFMEKAWVIWHCRSVFSHLRYRRQNHTFLPLDDNMSDSIAENDATQTRDIIDSLAVKLTPHERHALSLMADGYSADDIAETLGIKHESAVMLRHRIIEKLRNRKDLR